MERILKFGGSSVGSPERINSVIEIIRKAYAHSSRIAVVVSAFGGVTDQLIALGKMNPGDLAKNDKSAATNIVASKNVDEKKPDVIPAVSIQTSYPEGEFKINDTRVIYVKRGTSYLDIAQRYEIGLARLFEFNDLKPSEVTATDQLVFIQRKRKTGDHETHVVQSGEDLHTIAQTEAIRLESLLEYNNLAGGMQPAVGETLSLRSKTSLMPRLLSKNPLAQK